MPFFLLLAAVIDIDTSGIHALEDLYKNLQKRGIQVYRLKPFFFSFLPVYWIVVLEMPLEKKEQNVTFGVRSNRCYSRN
jgi:hypothetical protein